MNPRPSPEPVVVELRPVDGLRPHEHGLVPALDQAGREALQADIAERGIITPLEVTSEGVVLDGRERLHAAQALNLGELPVLVVAPADQVEHIVLTALQRRHLTPSQRAALALELDTYRQLQADGAKRQLANLKQNTEVATSPPRGKTRDQIARLAAVSARTAQDAITVHQHNPELFEQVKTGKIAAALAARRVRRAQRDAGLPPAPPLPDGPFQLIYADPPWQLGNPDGENAPERHYPCLPLEEIKELKVPAADNAVLFLWAVNCRLPQALEVIQAWGFSYKTNLVWVKPRPGLGYWARNQHELLLFATRGQIEAPDPPPGSVIQAPRGRHSQKPKAAYQLIETAYPQLSKLELFARGTPKPGWHTWGNETTPAAN